MKATWTCCVLAGCVAIPSTARATDVELEPRELAVEVGTLWRASATYADAIDGTLVTIGLDFSFAAEGLALLVGVRPTLAEVDDYRLVWASWAGPIAYFRDGPSGGVRAVSELQNVLHARPVLLMAAPKLGFAAAFGAQDGWRLRTALVLGAGIELGPFEIWLTAEGGYDFQARGPGVVALAASLVVTAHLEGIARL